MSGYPTVSFLEIDGKVLSGEEFEEYCRDHGLCKRCARARTHRRILKLFGKGKKWEPMTLHDELTGEYLVYKGYCLQPTCYTFGQAKRLLGENADGTRSRKGSSRRQRLAARFKRERRRPSKRRPKTNSDTGSVMSGAGDDDASISSDMSGMSQMSGMSGFSQMSGMSGMSGFSGFSGFRKGRKDKKKRSSSNASSASSVSSMDFSDDGTIDSTMDPDQHTVAEGQTSPIVAHRVEQLILYDYFTVLDLSKVELRSEDIDAVIGALEQAKTLESVTLDKCKLRDEGTERIMKGIQLGNHMNLKKLSLRQNSIGNKGAQSLEFLLRATETLEELDLSENSISSRGAASVLAALHGNPKVNIHTLNLSQNEIWDMDDGSFLRNNKTLKTFNLDGNFMHDEGAEQISKAIAENKGSIIEKLYLGWNGISDDGATALAKMMEVNSSLQVLGLAENDISNTGARAILSALAVNTSVREISGLYHNQIDRKFIIVAIKRLLHRYGERTGQPPVDNEWEKEGAKVELEEKHPVGEEKVPMDDEKSEGSSSSINWASQLYSTEDKEKSEETNPPTSVALEAIENWDWGTFGIEEIEAAGKPEAPPAMQDDDDTEPVEGFSPHHSGSLPVDRITFFRSAPLAYFNRHTTEHHEVPLLDFDYETQALEEALALQQELGADIELAFETATTDRLSAFFSQGFSPIMHFSGHGHRDCFALENGFGYMQALPQEDLKRFVATGKDTVQVVFVSSCHSLYMANAFLKAGIRHVVCCHRESTFRDEGPVEFATAFYQALAQKKSLKEAFDAGLEHVKKSPLVKTSRNVTDRFLLLPKMPEESKYHNVQVFFQNPLPKKPEMPDIDTTLLPPLPEQFVGREVDMYEILESLRVDDVIRVGGVPGSGKTSVISAVSRYILKRPKSFHINSVFWLPAPKGVVPEDDSLFGDLCQVMNWLVEAEDDIWDEEDYTECRERIMIELEDQKTILVIDGRVFTSEAAGENLERFLSHLLNEASVKIILMTAHEGSDKQSRTKRSRSEETIITIGPLNFKASSLLFGNKCKHISNKGNAVVHTAEEFADYLVPPSVKKQGADTNRELSRRQIELYERMGKGNTRAIMEAASNFSEEDLKSMLRFAQRPEVQVDSAVTLDNEIATRTAQQDKAIKGKNFLRAQDLAATFEELQSLKSKYPSLTDLQNKEKELKKDFSALLKERKYEDANKIKRKILALKKTMLKEKFTKPKAAPTASTKLQELQDRMDNMLAMAEEMKMSQSISELDGHLKDDSETAIFAISREGGACSLEISCGSIVDYRYDGMCGMVCWTNESCDLSTYDIGRKVIGNGAHNLEEEISELETVATTTWGPVKCATGEATRFGPRSFSKLAARYVVLAVSPLSPSNDDDDWDDDAFQDEDGLHYLDTGLRASYRSIFRKVNDTGVGAVGIPTITTKPKGRQYERTLRVGLQTLIEEAKFTKLKSIHLLASSGEEATLLIKTALGMGLNSAKSE
jgi:hypothetical protein